MDFFVNHRIKWPHEYVLSGQNKDRVTYNQLTPLQWMSVFCRGMKEESNEKIKDYMLDYVINLLDDANDFSWSSAKASHAVLLCRMEQGEVAGWSDVEKIDRIRRAHAQRHISQQGTQNAKNQDKSQNIQRKWFHVCITIKILVCKRRIMRPREYFKGMFVPLAGRWMASYIHILNLTVADQSQKTNKPGHVGTKETACPKNSNFSFQPSSGT